MSQVKEFHPAQFQSFPTMDLENNDFTHQNSWNSLHIPQGPISAPAAPSTGDDYFTFEAPSKAGPDDYVLSSQYDNTPHGVHSIELQQTHYSQWKPQQAGVYPVGRGNRKGGMRPRVTSDKKARHKSRLSNSITLDAEPGNSDNEQPHSGADHSYELTNREIGLNKDSGPQASFKRKNPGFHITLDNLLGSSLNVRPKEHDQTLVSVGSDSRLDLTYQNMRIQDPDVYFHEPGNEWDSGQENITPLMNPPNTNEMGYFGSVDVQLGDHTGALDGGMPGGFLSFPKDFERSSATRSDENSTDFDEFANIPLDGFSPVPESFEEFNHDFNHTNFDNHYGQNLSQNPQSHYVHLPSQSYNHLGQHLSNAVPQTHHRQPTHHIHQTNHDGGQPIVSSENYHSGLTANRAVLPTQYPQLSANSYGFEEQYRQTNSPAVSTQRTLFANRPVLERSQSAQSAMPPVVRIEGKKKKKSSRVVICPICDKHISRDFTRHSRIHNEIGRFQCVFPRSTCSHKSGKFNRPYDYKKHLLNVHFSFDDPKARLAPNLKEKLSVRGHCNSCGQHFTGNDWLEEHVLNTDKNKRCPKLQMDLEVDGAALKSAEIEEEELKEFLKQDLLE